jgi:hypothetical protein
MQKAAFRKAIDQAVISVIHLFIKDLQSILIESRVGSDPLDFFIITLVEGLQQKSLGVSMPPRLLL